MRFVKTPTGEVFKYEDCKFFDDDSCDSGVFFNTENQEQIAKELFDSTGILVADLKGGENTG